MARVDPATGEVVCKIVYFGPALSGKTTNLRVVHGKIPEGERGQLVLIAPGDDCELYCECTELDLGTMGGLRMRARVYALPGCPGHSETRAMMLSGADGVVFVADSGAGARDADVASLDELVRDLAADGLGIEEIGLVFQFNKRDLADAMPLEQMIADLDRWDAPVFEAVATRGEGVAVTLAQVCHLVVQKVAAGRRRPERGDAGGAAPEEADAAGSVPAAPSEAGRAAEPEDGRLVASWMDDEHLAEKTDFVKPGRAAPGKGEREGEPEAGGDAAARPVRTVPHRPAPDSASDSARRTKAAGGHARRHASGRGHRSGASLRRTDLSKDPVIRAVTDRLDLSDSGQPMLGEFELLQKLGESGLGVVYGARQTVLDTEVAVNVLPPQAAGSRRLVEIFLGEARSAAQARSDHLVRMLHAETDARTGLHYMVVEYVSGLDAAECVEDAIRSGKPGLSEEIALTIVGAATEGLAAVHELGEVHRDVKPTNIFVPRLQSGGGRSPTHRPGAADGKGLDFAAAKLGDYGLVKPRDVTELTKAGFRLYTAGFSAAEQYDDAAELTPAADVFGMGATLYFLLTGHSPFEAESLKATIGNTILGEYAELAEARDDVSLGVVEVVGRCLMKNPGARPRDAAELIEALGAIR